MLLKVRYYTYLPGQLEVWLGEGLWPAAYSNSSLTDGWKKAVKYNKMIVKCLSNSTVHSIICIFVCRPLLVWQIIAYTYG